MSVFDLAAQQEARVLVHAPICIVGAGMAGLVLARKLARNGQRVLLVESGGRNFEPSIHDLNALEDASGHYTRAMTGHYRGLGGSSSRWGGRMIPINPGEARPRDYLSQSGWPFPLEELAVHLPEIEALFGLHGSSFGEEMLDQFDPKGFFPHGDPDFTCRWAKWPKFSRCNLANVMRQDIGSPGLQVWLNATVYEFVVDTGQARLKGIKARNYAGKELLVTADHFVLAAGTIETTRLLLWLKANTNDHAFEKTKVLGRYFQDHLNARVATISRQDAALSNELFGYRFANGTRRSLHLELTSSAQKTDNVASAFAYVTMDLAGTALEKVKAAARGLQQGRFELAEMAGLARNLPLLGQSALWRAVRHRLFVPPDVPFHLDICAEQTPHWDNAICLSDVRDRLGLPKAHLNWQPTGQDERTLRSAVRRLANYWSRSGLQRLAPLSWIDACMDEQGSIVGSAHDYAHPSGTTRMGTTSSDSVVAPDLTCHEIANLSIVSASVFPTAGSANPTLTVLELALRLADTLLARRPITGPSAQPQAEHLPAL